METRERRRAERKSISTAGGRKAVRRPKDAQRGEKAGRVRTRSGWASGCGGRRARNRRRWRRSAGGIGETGSGVQYGAMLREPSGDVAERFSATSDAFSRGRKVTSELHASAASRTGENVEVEGTHQKLGPCAVGASARRCGWLFYPRRARWSNPTKPRAPALASDCDAPATKRNDGPHRQLRVLEDEDGGERQIGSLDLRGFPPTNRNGLVPSRAERGTCVGGAGFGPAVLAAFGIERSTGDRAPRDAPDHAPACSIATSRSSETLRPARRFGV